MPSLGISAKRSSISPPERAKNENPQIHALAITSMDAKERKEIKTKLVLAGRASHQLPLQGALAFIKLPTPATNWRRRPKGVAARACKDFIGEVSGDLHHRHLRLPPWERATKERRPASSHLRSNRTGSKHLEQALLGGMQAWLHLKYAAACHRQGAIQQEKHKKQRYWPTESSDRPSNAIRADTTRDKTKP